MATPGLPSSTLRKAYVSGPSSMRATSRRYVTEPSSPVLMTIAPNSCSVRRRPWALTVYSNSGPATAGWAPRRARFRIQPQSHGVVPGPKQPDVAHTRQAREHVPDLDDAVIAQVQ